MKVLNNKELARLTGVDDPAGQVAALRQHGLHPFVCPKSGRPRVTWDAVNLSMTRPASNGNFVGNSAAFR